MVFTSRKGSKLVSPLIALLIEETISRSAERRAESHTVADQAARLLRRSPCIPFRINYRSYVDRRRCTFDRGNLSPAKCNTLARPMRRKLTSVTIVTEPPSETNERSFLFFFFFFRKSYFCVSQMLSDRLRNVPKVAAPLLTKAIIGEPERDWKETIRSTS